MDKKLLSQAAKYIQEADSIIITAGAGMGVDSGLPDFRGNEGFWKAYPALARAKLDFSEVASPTTFNRDIKLAWGFYGHRLELYRNTIPHVGFEVLKRWGESKPNGYNVFTSNVDGQFQKAGFDPHRIYECHGSIHHLQCLEPCVEDVWSAEAFKPEVNAEQCLLTNIPPHCPKCGDYARPNILMFSDWGWVNTRSKRQAAQLNTWLAQTTNPVIIELGAGTHIPSVRDFSHKVVTKHNGNLIRINPRESEVETKNSIGLACGAKDALLAIDHIMNA
jgi:NAD-dependent SIR2 family protein deacetylase